MSNCEPCGDLGQWCCNDNILPCPGNPEEGGNTEPSVLKLDCNSADHKCAACGGPDQKCCTLRSKTDVECMGSFECNADMGYCWNPSRARFSFIKLRELDMRNRLQSKSY